MDRYESLLRLRFLRTQLGDAAVERLGRAVREARANLMVRVARAHPRAGKAAAPIFAMLHHPLLAFAEAALAAPKKARDGDAKWLANNIGHTYVELRSRDPIGLDGDLDNVTLRVAGRRQPALLLTTRRGDSGHVYRIAFAPFVLAGDVGLTRLELRLPDGTVARWGLSARNVQGLRERPQVGRNEPCPCGSGKKYKQCHGAL